jgi:microcystin-dependent protein
MNEHFVGGIYMAGFNFATTGNGSSFNVLRPYLMGSYFIAPMGIFPSRN